MTKKQYDIIGDIHGCAKELQALLKKLGYVEKDGVYQHPARTAIFLGDFIDRGPDQAGVLATVRPMIDGEHALAVMGNHEFNAICFSTQIDGGYVRPHNDSNTRQHQAFLDEFPFGSPEHRDAIAWFKTLPVYLDLGDIGIVHACWDEQSFKDIGAFLNSDQTLTGETYTAFADERSVLFSAIERVLKGPEHPLPNEMFFKDKDGHERRNARIKWWAEPTLPTAEKLDIPDDQLTVEQLGLLNSDSISRSFNVPARPTFVGHYWRKGTPELLSDTVACVDYSVAKGEKMAAYQWDGEQTLDASHFTWV